MPLAYPAGIRKDIWRPSRSCTATSRNKSPPSGKTGLPTRIPSLCQGLPTVSTESGLSSRPSNPLAAVRRGLHFPTHTKGRLAAQSGRTGSRGTVEFELQLHLALSLPTMRLLTPEAAQSAAKPQDTFPLISRRELVRAALFASVAAALGPAFSFAQAVESGLTPAARGENGAAFLKDPNWKLAFLNDQQNETLIALNDVMIPATNSPGAKEALVNRYLDLLISVQPAEFQQQFVDALNFMDRAS